MRSWTTTAAATPALLALLLAALLAPATLAEGGAPAAAPPGYVPTYPGSPPGVPLPPWQQKPWEQSHRGPVPETHPATTDTQPQPGSDQPAPHEPATEPAPKEDVNKAVAPVPPVAPDKVLDLPPLAGVVWLGPAADLDALYGQTVVVVFVQTGLLTSDEDAPEMARQVHEAAVRLPVTVIYLGLGESKPAFENYLKRHGIEGQAAGVAPRVLAREFGLSGKSWQAVAISGRGEQVWTGSLTGYRNNGGRKESILAADLPGLCGGAVPLVEPGKNADLKRADLAARLGMYDTALKLLDRSPDGIQAKARLLARGHDLVASAKYYETQAPAPYLAWRLAHLAAREFKGQELGKEAAAIEARLEGLPAVRAGQAGDVALTGFLDACKRQGDPRGVTEPLQQLAQRARGTRAGRVAARALATKDDTGESPDKKDKSGRP